MRGPRAERIRTSKRLRSIYRVLFEPPTSTHLTNIELLKVFPFINIGNETKADTPNLGRVHSLIEIYREIFGEPEGPELTPTELLRLNPFIGEPDRRKRASTSASNTDMTTQGY